MISVVIAPSVRLMTTFLALLDVHHRFACTQTSVVVKDLRLKDEDEDEDLKIGLRGSSRTRTFLEDNNAVNPGSQINARVF